MMQSVKMLGNGNGKDSSCPLESPPPPPPCERNAGVTSEEAVC